MGTAGPFSSPSLGTVEPVVGGTETGRSESLGVKYGVGNVAIL